MVEGQRRSDFIITTVHDYLAIDVTSPLADRILSTFQSGKRKVDRSRIRITARRGDVKDLAAITDAWPDDWSEQ